MLATKSRRRRRVLKDDIEDVVVKPPKVGLWHTSVPVLSEAIDDYGNRQLVHPGMWPSQRRWWDLKNRVRLLVGGYGAGKTKQLCRRMISLAIHNGPVPVAIVSPTYPMAKKTVILTLQELLEDRKQWLDYWARQGVLMSRLEWSENKTPPHEFTIRYHREGFRSIKGTIVIYSGENPDKLKGSNLAAAGIDEPFIQDEAVFQQMYVRCRHPLARLRELNLTGTPEQLNWGYDLCEGDLADKYNVGVVQMSTLENKALPEDYIKSLIEAWDERVAAAYLHGQFVNLARGRVYYAFDREENVVELPMPQNARIGAGMDFNVNPMCATLFWYIEKGVDRHIHFFDEVELPNSDTLEMARTLRKHYGEAGSCQTICDKSDHYDTTEPLQVVYPDSNAGRSTTAPGGKTDYDYLEEVGFQVETDPRGNGLRKDRFNAVNGLLRATGGRVRMTISPRCKKLIKYQMLYSHEHMTTPLHKSMSHLLDARDYPVVRLFPADRERLKLIPIQGV